MTAARNGRQHVLLVRTQSIACALPLADVTETMRALPVEPLAGAPRFVRGVAIIRGSAVPVIDLAMMLGASDEAPGGRFVTVRIGERCAAVAVDAVLGVRELEPSATAGLPPLLATVAGDVIDTIGTLDGGLLLALRAARIVPPETWQMLDAREAGA